MRNVGLLALWFLVFESVSAEDITFRHLTINDGLSQNAVFAILQDRRGFMWFGTKDGLNKYDGYSFTTFHHDPFDSTSISANYITTLFEDSRGVIWIGTIDGGVNIFERGTETFRRLTFRTLESEVTGTVNVQCIAEDSLGSVWLGTKGNGLLRLPRVAGTIDEADFTQYRFDPKNAESDDNDISALFVDSEGEVWVGSGSGLRKFVSNKNLFKHFPMRTKNPKAPAIRNEDRIFSIAEGQDGVLWLGVGSGVVKFMKSDGSYSLFTHHYDVYRYGWGSVTGILEDRSGKLWLTTPSELMRFDPVHESYEYFRNDPFDARSISYNGVSSIWRDRSGVFWFGTPGAGVNVYDPKANRFSTLVRKKDASSRVTGFSVRSVLEDKSGRVWISTDILYAWNRSSGELKSFETTSNRPDDFGNTGVWSMIEALNGTLWFATSRGLYSVNPTTSNIRRYKFIPSDSSGLRQQEVYAVFEDRNRTIWIASEDFLSKLTDVEKGRFQHFRYRRTPSRGERISPVICEDGRGWLWLGTENGLLRFNPTSGTFDEFLSNPTQPTSLNNNAIKSVCPDPRQPDRILWVGTAGGGLNRFDMETARFDHITTRDGLPNNVVYGILPDGNGFLWLSTNKGLSRFNVRTNEFRNYDVSDGLQSNEFNTGASFRSRSGEMFFGGINGLNYFYPDSVKDNPFVPEIVLTGLKLDNKEATIRGEGSILTTVISETRSLKIPAGINIITLEFAALGFSSSGKNQYAYKMDNFSSNWIASGTVRTATYTHLPPGMYTFRVKGSNGDGVWNERGVSLDITVMAPWWRTWWAYGLYVLFALSAILILRRYEMNRIRLENALKLETIEAVKLKEIDRVKSRFFANISHEFRTPLTLILGQIDSVMSSDIETKEKGKLQVALRNARRLLTLINQLLDLSKIEAGSMELRAECYNLVSFLKNVIYSFESLAEQKKISLEFRSDEARIPALFEQDKMEKVFYNLLSNAFKFTPEGGRVSVEVKRVDERVRVSVSDTGIGIPADQLPHVFDRFYQVDSSQTREHEGTGIGLAFAKELIELHGGTISVSSKQGEGTVFVVLLPFNGGQSAVDSKEERMDETETGRAEEFIDSPVLPLSDAHGIEEVADHPISLVVEDNEDVRLYIREQLANSYKVVEAMNGEEGITTAQEIVPDVIITDLMMPRVDGYEFTRRIRCDEKTSHIPIIMLTAKAGLDDKIEGLEKGVDVYLTKPFSAKELKVQVKNLILRREELRRRFSSATIIKPSEIAATSVDRAFLEKTVACVEANFENEGFGVEQLAANVNMSISQLNRKLNALIDQPAGELIRSMRLQRAADLLKQNAGTAAEISYRLGFTDQAYFSRAFKKKFGHTPSEYRKL